MENKLVTVPLSQLFEADWNYKTNNKAMMNALVGNMKQRGQIQLILIREMGREKYEIVNGNHRYRALLDIGAHEAVCLNLGTINLAQAKRIAFETNETEFTSDPIKLGDIVKELTGAFAQEDLEGTLPFSKKEIADMANLTTFDFDDHEDEAFDEGSMMDEETVFDLDDSTPVPPAPKEEEKEFFVLEFLMAKNVRDDFAHAYAMLRDKLSTKQPKTSINDDYEVGFIIKMLREYIEKKASKE